MIKTAILGATGYIGIELVRLLSSHKYVEIKFLGARADEKEKKIKIKMTEYTCKPIEQIEECIEELDVVFLALPHTISMEIANELFNLNKKIKIIDLSADFRLKDKKLYEKWYKKEHEFESLLKEAVYGLPEIYREKESIKRAKLIANPGCYSTAAILGLYPLKEEIEDEVIIDAKSGISGAGKEPTYITHFCQRNENISPYNVLSHRHQPEIEQLINKKIIFTPHMIPVDRGILTTIYVKLKSKIKDIYKIYEDYYKGEEFIKLMPADSVVSTKDVLYTNYCAISLHAHDENLVICVVIDNLMKGGAGNALQNLNILYSLSEDEGLK